MKIAALQMVSTPRVEDNLAQAEALIAEAARAGARLVALPEYFCLMGQRDDDKLAIAEADGHGPIQDALAAQARRHGLWVVGGTLPLHGTQPGRVRNACLVWGPRGQRVARYDKIHLFAFDNGREHYDEARVLEPGDTPVTFTVTDPDGGPDWRVGLAICYDLRFPELFRALTPPGCPADLLIVPAAFTHTTGQAHWELLLRARAVENQCHVLAPAQGGLHENGRRTWGHSLAIDPWGQVLACQPEGPGVVLAELDAARRDAVRTQLPALAHRKLPTR